MRLPLVWFYGTCAISASLVVTSALWALVGEAPGFLGHVLAAFVLMGENNPAAWWSGMLLALLSLHAFDGYVVYRREAPRAAQAWLLLAVVFIILSADEVGSFHERVSALGKYMGIGKWLPLLPFAVVLATMLGRALAILWRVEVQRHKVRPIAAGFLILGFAVVFDALVLGAEGEAKAAVDVIEEAAELLGMLILLKVTMSHTAGLAPGRTAAGGAAFAAVIELRRPLLLGGLAVAPVLAIATGMVEDTRGRPADWLAALALVGAALAAFRPAFSGGRLVRWQNWSLAALCLLASVAMTVDPVRLVEVAGAGVSLRSVILASIVLPIAIIWVLQAGRMPAHLGGAVVLALLVGGLLLASGAPVMIYLLSQTLALVVLFVIATAADLQRSHDLVAPAAMAVAAGGE